MLSEPILFRDYLRCHGNECKLYADMKYRLMQNNPNDRELYVRGKEPIIWEMMRRASAWSQQTGWKPRETDI